MQQGSRRAHRVAARSAVSLFIFSLAFAHFEALEIQGLKLLRAPFTVTAPQTKGPPLGANIPIGEVAGGDFAGPKTSLNGQPLLENNHLPAVPHASALRHMMPEQPKGDSLKSVQNVPGLPAWQDGPQISPIIKN